MGRQRARSLKSFLAFVGVSVPFVVYFSAPRFADEMRDPYTMTARFGLNPFKIVAGNLRDVGPFLDVGNVRPLGRIAYSFEFVYSKGLADALGVPMPFVHAIVRTAALWATLAAIAGLWTVFESYGLRSRPSLARMVGLGACATAFATLSTWSHQPLVFFPVQGLMSVALVCLGTTTALRFAASGGWRLAVGSAALGAVCASFYDLAYVVVVAAPVALGGLRCLQRRARRIRAPWSAGLPLLTGFGVVFIPIRVLIVRACAQQACYQGSEIELTAKAIPTFVARLMAALPQTYWTLGVDSWTWWTIIIAPGVGLGVAAAALWAARNLGDDLWADHQSATGESRQRGEAGAAVLIVLVGFVTWMMASAMSALSASQQGIGFNPHFPWRDGIFGFLFLATLSWAVIERLAQARSPISFKLAVAVLAALVSVQFFLNVATIVRSRTLDPNPVYGRVDELFAGSSTDDDVCEVADDLYTLVQDPGTRYYSTVLLEAMKRLKPIDGCRAYEAPLKLDEWHRRQLGDLD